MDKLLVPCLIISILGILVLLSIPFVIKPKQISSYSDLKENSYVQITGKIISIKTYPNYDDFSIITLDKNITLICNCKFPINTTIKAQGKVEIYNNKLQINADKIENAA